MTREYFVASRDVRLHVVERGEPHRPRVLLAHGFPDCHAVYDAVMDDLARDHHVVTFDMRGVGRSAPPDRRDGYRIPMILPDFDAVGDAAFGRREPFHLVGHDWGSVLGFSYVADRVRGGRVLSFTSASGPHLALMWEAAASAFRGSRELRAAALEQLASSWYAFAIQLPLLPELLVRRSGPRMIRRALTEGGVSEDDPYLDVTPDEAYGRVRHALGLYRQNALRPPALPAPGSIDTPIQLLVATNDPFVHPIAHSNLERFATDVERWEVEASHWMPRTHPERFAARVREFVGRHDEATSQSSE